MTEDIRFFNNYDTVSVIEAVYTRSSTADIHAFGAANDGDSVHTHGLKTAGDGGGGDWIWNNSADKATANLGTIIDPDKDFTLDAQGTGTGSGCWVRDYSGAVEVKWFGAVGNGLTDDYRAIQAGLDFVVAESSSMGYLPVGAGGNTHPTIELHFDVEKNYKISKGLTVNKCRSFALISDGRTVISSEDFNDYLLTVTGTAHAHWISGFVFESSQAGCIKYDADNVSGSLIDISNCRFITDRYGHESGIAIDLTCQSSNVRVQNCYFNRVKHAVHKQNCDFLHLTDCWFGFPVNSVFENKDAYIRNDSGRMYITTCLFAGGPADNPVGGGASNGVEIAFFNNGVEGEVNSASLTIRDTRIGFEDGSGVLVNHFSPYCANKTTGKKNSILFDNIYTSPREEKLYNIEGTKVGYLVRLFTMPNQIAFRNIEAVPAKLGLIGPGSTTTLACLRGTANTPIDYSSDIATYANEMLASNHYIIDNVSAGKLYTVVASTPGPSMAEHYAWLELFRKFNYFFPSDFPSAGSGGNSPIIVVDTYFTNFTDSSGAVFEVFGAVYPNTGISTAATVSIYGHIVIYKLIETDQMTIYYTTGVDHSHMPAGIEITPFFVVDHVQKSSITIAESTNATLRVRLHHEDNPRVENIRCRGLVVRPIQASLPSDKVGSLFQGT